MSVCLNFHPLYISYLLFFTTVHFMVTRIPNPSPVIWFIVVLGYVLFLKNYQNVSIQRLMNEKVDM